MFGIGDYPPRHLHYPRHVRTFRRVYALSSATYVKWKIRQHSVGQLLGPTWSRIGWHRPRFACGCCFAYG
jgi:hypothetical protein